MVQAADAPSPILITGASGFLGRRLVSHLLERGRRLRLIARPASDLGWLPAGSPVDVIRQDLADPQDLAAALQGCAQVVHAAGLFRFWGPEARFNQVNLQPTANLLAAARQAGVRRFIHISTIAVIGQPPPGQLIDESTPCQPVDAYQRSKLAAEQLVLAANQPAGLQTVVLRPGAFYGPGGRYGFNRLFIEEPLRGLRIQVDGGRRITFFVYVPDVARAVGLALVSGRAGEIYNICDDACSHRQINTLVSQIAGISAWRLNAPRRLMVSLARLMEAWAALTRQEPFYPLNLEHYVFQDWPASNAKARRELGFTPTPLAEGLRATIDWYRRPLR